MLADVLHSRPWITVEDEASVTATLATGFLAQGAIAARFEDEMASWLKTSGGVATGSGGAALVLALRALGCGPGSEVILTTYVCRTVLDAVVATGAKPMLCDAGPDWVVRAEEIAPHVTPRTRAIIVAHLYGIFADLPAIRAFGVPIVEDACQALGTTAQHTEQGDCLVLSFHPTKCLTTGEGGMVLGRDPSLVARVRKLRDGIPGKPGREFSPLPDLSAALGLSQLRRYPEFLRRRHDLAAKWRSALATIPGLGLDRLNGVSSMHFRFPLQRAGGLDACAAHFATRGIHVRRGVDALLHRLLGLSDHDFPIAVGLIAATVSLPIYPALDSESFNRSCAAAVEIFSGHE